MASPRAVVIPFGVPAQARGLGIGLAGLIQTLVTVEGEEVAVAQLRSHGKRGPFPANQGPLEAYVAPDAWRDVAGRGDGPQTVAVVVTGAFDPPTDGSGSLQLLAFGADDGQMRARIDLPLDDGRAGDLLAGAIDQLGARLGGRVLSLDGLRGLAWEPLESVLYAERCALHDPTRGGPHDPLAAVIHLGRAIQEAPTARYPVVRLSALTFSAFSGRPQGDKAAAAAVRVLERAAEDAPDQVELVESLATLRLRMGNPREAEHTLSAAIARFPGRARLYASLAESLRAQNKLEAALSVLKNGEKAAGPDPLMASERGAVLALWGDLDGAAAVWRKALESDAPLHPQAFVGLVGLVLRSSRGELGAGLVDAALAAPGSNPDVLRAAAKLVVATEPEGLARAARLAALCKKILERAPGDSWAALALAQAQLTLGDTEQAKQRLAWVQRFAPDSAPASEAQALQQAIDDPSLGRTLEGLARGARQAPEDQLERVAAQARRLATLHDAWPAWLTAAVADRRRGKLDAARSALRVALELAPGAPAVNVELSEVLGALGDAPGCRRYAQRAMDLGGETPRTLLALAEALALDGKRREALAAATRAVSMQPQNERARALVRDLESTTSSKGWLEKMWTWWDRRSRRCSY